MDFNTRLLGLHRRNYCSITRVVDEFYKSTDPGQIQAQNKAITRIISEHVFHEKNGISICLGSTAHQTHASSHQRSKIAGTCMRETLLQATLRLRLGISIALLPTCQRNRRNLLHHGLSHFLVIASALLSEGSWWVCSNSAIVFSHRHHLKMSCACPWVIVPIATQTAFGRRRKIQIKYISVVHATIVYSTIHLKLLMDRRKKVDQHIMVIDMSYVTQ